VDHSLKDGTRVLVRPIEPSDKVRLRVALGRLSQDAIRRRFLAAKPRFSSGELSYLTEIDGHNHLALVAVLADDPESIVAVARCVRLPLPRPEASSPLRSAPETAEFAIVVGDPFQRRGLGTLMARALADAARDVGIRRFAATMLSNNVAVRRLMDTFTEGLGQERVAHGVRELVVDLAA
jgi:RimJ/RimL family protein N-acetyltransferase